jgi:hypothetical protein
MICKLIVNRNGLLSACPTRDVFKANAFLTDPERFFVVQVYITRETYQHLFENRDNAFILHKQLPVREDKPDRVYYQVVTGKLTRCES